MVEVSRREVLLGALALPFGFSRKQEGGQQAHEQTQLLDGPVVINGRNFYCLPFPFHGSFEWEVEGQDIQDAIGKADFVMPEYDPDEYESVFTIPLFGSTLDTYIAGNVAFFQKVIQACKTKGKDIWMVDPAYTLAFGAVRVLSRLPYFIPEELATVAGVHVAKHVAIDEIKQVLHKEDENRATKILRSTFLSLGIGTVLAAVANLYEWQNGEDQPQGSMAMEDDFRRVVISGLASMLAHSDNLPKGANILLLYPEHHWRPTDGTVGIEEYMQHPELLEKQLQGYMDILRVLPDLGRARLHTPEHESGNPIKIVSIPT